MDYGLCLPNFREGASREGMEAAAETAERLGWSTVWATDHILVASEDADDYGRIYDAILSLTWIVVGGRAEAALRRAGTLGDGYQSSATSAAKYAERVPVIRAAAEAAGRPMPSLTARAYTQFGPATNKFYAIRGTLDEMAAEVRAFEALGVRHMALWFDATDPAEVSALVERFAREVAPLV